MPTYDYRCKACGHELELFQSISEAPKRKCPKCKKQKLERRIGGGAGFLFKGSGFYLTDYRSAAYKKAADADGKPPSNKGGPTDKSSTDKGSSGKSETGQSSAPIREKKTGT
jgi:putative FmdB family regulatory protein